MWDIMKRINLKIILIEKESQHKCPGNTFNKITEYFPNLKMCIPMNVQESTEQQFDWNRKRGPVPHNNQNTKYIKQIDIKRLKGKK